MIHYGITIGTFIGWAGRKRAAAANAKCIGGGCFSLLPGHCGKELNGIGMNSNSLLKCLNFGEKGSRQMKGAYDKISPEIIEIGAGRGDGPIYNLTDNYNSK